MPDTIHETFEDGDLVVVTIPGPSKRHALAEYIEWDEAIQKHVVCIDGRPKALLVESDAIVPLKEFTGELSEYSTPPLKKTRVHRVPNHG